MIIKEIHIDGFGIFNAFSLQNLKNGINIIQGRNEAGKSTLLKFLRYTLFGYPRFTNQRMEPLMGGKHQGRIIAVLSSGKEVIFERNGNDNIRLHIDGSISQNASLWMDMLGNADRSLFENVYAFTLDELISLNKLTGSGVEDRIFSIGMGLGSASLSSIMLEIESNADKIFKKSGRKHLLAEITAQIKVLRDEIKKIQNNLPEYQKIAGEIKTLEDDALKYSEMLNELRNECAKINNYFNSYESYIDFINANTELSKLPSENNYPENGLEKLESLLQNVKNLQERISELESGTDNDKGITQLQEKINNIIYDVAIIEQKDTVNYLKENIAKYIQHIEDKNSELQEIDNLERNIQKTIKNEINSAWDKNKLEAFAGYNEHNSKINSFKTTIDKISGELSTLEAKMQITQHKDQKFNPLIIIIAISLFFFMFALVFIFFESNYHWGGILLVISLFLFLMKNKFIVKSSNNTFIIEIEELKKQKANIQKEYQSYLVNSIDLPGTLLPDNALQTLNSIRQLQDVSLKGLYNLNSKLKNQREPFIADFENRVEELVKIFNSFNKDDNYVILARQIIEKFNAHIAGKQEQEKLIELLKAKQREHEIVTSKLKLQKDEINKLYNAVNAKDENEYREKFLIYKKVKELQVQKNNSIQSIQKIAGHSKFQDVITFLDENEKETIELKKISLESEIKKIEQVQLEKQNELGAKKNEINRLGSESQLFELLTEFESKKENFNNAFKEWLTYKIALNILNDVKTGYEKEKQPEVIKNSAKYFKIITSAQYESLNVSIDNKDRNVNIYDKRGLLKNIDQLSRGTKEQLLISLRLGFIEEYEKKSEPLPVVTDEVLVNFDTQRAKHTAKVLHEFAKERQLILFTCHSYTSDLFNGMEINRLNM